MIKFLKSTKLLIKAFPLIILFEIIYKLIANAIILPIVTFIINKAISISDVGYITINNLGKFCSNPYVILLLLLIFVICSIFTIVELSTIIGGLALYAKNEKATLAYMMKIGGKTALKLFRGLNFVFIFFILLIFPITQFSLASEIFAFIGVPNLTSFYSVTGNKVISIIVIVFFSIIPIFLIDRMYAVHFFTLTKYSYPQSVKKSKELLKDKKLKMFLSTIVWTAFIITLFLGVFFLISFVIAGFSKGFNHPDIAFYSAYKSIKRLLKITMAISSVFVIPVFFSFITQSFFVEINEDDTVDISEIVSISEKKIKPVRLRIIIFTVSAVAFFLNYSFIGDISSDNIRLNISFINKVKVTAHRGASKVAPENTEPAFISAVEIGCDYIELDVQLSADNEIVVFHDKNLKRVTGFDANVKDVSYNQLLNLDYGAYFGEEFENTGIMTLQEVFETLDKNINFNIEIKNYGDEVYIAERVAELIEEYECEKSCYVTSFSYAAITKVKKTNSNIKTALITNSVLYSGQSRFKHADAVSVNKNFVTQNFVNKMHSMGKSVFVWTVNSPEEMENLISMGIDNIITDDPLVAIRTISNRGADKYIISFLRWLFNY